MSDMTEAGYAPKTCAKAFRLFKQALKWAQAQDLIAKNPCDYCKPPKTGSSARTIPLTKSIFALLTHMKGASIQQASQFDIPFNDPYILGTQEPESRPYNPTQLGKDFSAFCKMNGFDCTFHDLRHTFATMMIANGCDVRTVASYLGHASVSMTLDIYADVDPDAKKATLSKVEDSFDFDSEYFNNAMEWHGASKPAVPTVSFTEEQLLAMLEQVRAQKSGDGSGAVCA